MKWERRELPWNAYKIFSLTELWKSRLSPPVSLPPFFTTRTQDSESSLPGSQPHFRLCFFPLGPTSHCPIRAFSGFLLKPADPCQRDGSPVPWSLACILLGKLLLPPSEVELLRLPPRAPSVCMVVLLLEKGTFSSRQATSTCGDVIMEDAVSTVWAAPTWVWTCVHRTTSKRCWVTLMGVGWLPSPGVRLGVGRWPWATVSPRLFEDAS